MFENRLLIMNTHNIYVCTIYTKYYFTSTKA